MSLLFPELDEELARTRPGPEEVPAPAPEDGPRSRTAGAKVTALFDRAFGLPRFFPTEGGCHVRRVVGHPGERLEVEISGGGVSPLTFWLEPPGRPNSYAATGDFSLWYTETEPALRRDEALRWVAARLKHVSFRVLVQLLESDTDAEEVPLEPGPGGGADPESTRTPPETRTEGGVLGFEIPDSLVYSFRSPVSWRCFFEGQEMWRGYCGDHAGVMGVHHADIECDFASARPADGTVTFFNYLPARKPVNGRMVTTHVSDIDVIKGGGRKLDEVLDALAASGEVYSSVIVNSSCIANITGDDIDASVERAAKKLRMPILSTGRPTSHEHQYIQIARNTPGFFEQQKNPGTFNIAGLPNTDGARELVGLLAEAGAALNCWILPSLDIETFRRYLAANVQVHYDWNWNATAYEALSEFPLPTIRPRSPFGVEASLKWLREVAAAVGRSDALEALLERRWRPLEQHWERLRREARGQRLGIVADAAWLERMRRPDEFQGVPVLEMLAEMGFGLDLLLHRPADEQPAKIEGLPFEDVRVLHFSTPADLELLMRSSDAQAFYSDMYFDQRLTRVGKNHFSLRQLDMGLEGAVASLRRLLARCSLPFYRKYGRFMGAPFRREELR